MTIGLPVKLILGNPGLFFLGLITGDDKFMPGKTGLFLTLFIWLSCRLFLIFFLLPFRLLPSFVSGVAPGVEPGVAQFSNGDIGIFKPPLEIFATVLLAKALSKPTAFSGQGGLIMPETAEPKEGLVKSFLISL